MTDMVKGAFGGKTRAMKEAEANISEQRALIQAEKDKVAKVEAGQQANRGGRRGLLAWFDDNLGTNFGGADVAGR